FKFGYAQDGKTMALNYKITNGLGYDIMLGANATAITVENIGKLGRNSYTGYCYPNLTILKQGATISCTVMILGNDAIPTANRKAEFTLTFTYGNCNAAPGYSTNHDCTGAPNHTVSGQIRAQLEPNVTKLYGCGAGVCDYVLGENSTACCFDCPVANLAFKTNASSSRSGIDPIEVNVTATYMDGTPAADATVSFDANSTGRQFIPPSGITNSTDQITTIYKGSMIGPRPATVAIIVTTCRKKANVTVTAQ
ncbi:hypothetical protein H0N98_02185, partial [Candidatus Micrarchaeota archaeon]|nr:hypothetical protein [Candidatus Micrarchaeota archaeon]